MKKLTAFLFLMCMSISAMAGFEGLNQGSSLKTFNRINCGTGLTCTKAAKGTLNVANTGIAGIAQAAAGALTSSQCGTTFYNAAAVEVDLPEASTVLGCRYTFVTLNASNFDLDPDDADIIVNATNVAGDKSRNATVGNSITIQAVSASQWAVLSINGTWADAN